MKTFKVIAVSANFANGVLKLDADQARARAHALEDLGDGYFEILSTVQFKRGEIVGFDGPISKALLQEVEEEGVEKKEEVKEPKPTGAHEPPASGTKPAKAPKPAKAAKKARG